MLASTAKATGRSVSGWLLSTRTVKPCKLSLDNAKSHTSWVVCFSFFNWWIQVQVYRSHFNCTEIPYEVLHRSASLNAFWDSGIVTNFAVIPYRWCCFLFLIELQLLLQDGILVIETAVDCRVESFFFYSWVLTMYFSDAAYWKLVFVTEV